VKRRAAQGTGPSGAPAWLLVVLLICAAVAVVAITALARQRSERRLAAQAVASGAGQPPTALDARPPEEEEEPDPVLEKALSAAEAADASVAALDVAAHVLLVRERFEEAEPLVLRALAASPKDIEATIHRAVLRGVLGDVPGARAELDRLARGPAGWEASLFAAGFALRDGDEVAALRAFRRFRETAPRGEVTPELATDIARLEARLGPSTGKK
jgi:tetratricopeptide (TPR) repeat protein